MAICLRLYLAHQSDFNAYTRAPRTLGIWLQSPHPRPDFSLQDAWEDLDGLLTGAAGSPSPLRPEFADWTYPQTADHGAHAISTASTQRLLQTIQHINRGMVETYLESRSAAATSPAGQDSLTPEELAAATQELLVNLDRLHVACELAVKKGFGILMALWDEPPRNAV